MKKTPATTSFETFPLVRIKWLDACHMGGNGWHTQEDLEVPLLAAESAGYLVFEGTNKHGEECVVVASALLFKTDGKPEFCPSFSIPKKMILKVEVL